MKTPAELSQPDLDTRIAIAEARLVARQQQLQWQWQALRTRAERAAKPRRLVLPAAAALLALVALRSLSRRPEQRSATQLHHHARHETPSLFARWMRWIVLALPLLPLHWRERLGPTPSSAVLSLALPLVRRAWDGRHEATPPASVAKVDLQRYAGHWHEIARLPTPHESRCVSQPSAEYRPCPQGLQVLNRCRTAEGRELVASGLARVVPGGGGARLEVSFAPSWLHWLPFVWADYWILHVGADYGIALVGTPARDALWLLSRQSEVSVEQFRELVGVAREQGYDLSKLRFS